MESVTWRKDGVVVGPEFAQMQTITDTLVAAYWHTLSSNDVTNFIGNFTCEVGANGRIDMLTQLIHGT